MPANDRPFAAVASTAKGRDGEPPMRRGVGALLALGLLVGLLGTAVIGSAMAVLGTCTPPAATPAALAKVPPGMLALYQAAAATCPGLLRTVLAAIGTIESDNGQSDLAGVHSGANAAGVEGPMQFEPATLAFVIRATLL